MCPVIKPSATSPKPIPASCPIQAVGTSGSPIRLTRSRRGRQRYALRMVTVEPAFRQIKQGRGFRQFLLRGLEKVNWEWLLICASHNLLKPFRFGSFLTNQVGGNGPAGGGKELLWAPGPMIFKRLSAPGICDPKE